MQLQSCKVSSRIVQLPPRLRPPSRLCAPRLRAVDGEGGGGEGEQGVQAGPRGTHPPPAILQCEVCGRLLLPSVPPLLDPKLLCNVNCCLKTRIGHPFKAPETQPSDLPPQPELPLQGPQQQQQPLQSQMLPSEAAQQPQEATSLQARSEDALAAVATSLGKSLPAEEKTAVQRFLFPDEEELPDNLELPIWDHLEVSAAVSGR